MNKFIKIIKNKEIICHIIFTALIILIIQAISIISFSGIKIKPNLDEIFKSVGMFNLMDLLADRLLKSFQLLL